MHELSLDELEAEMSAELPARAMMRHRRRHHHVGGGTSASAAFGSVANANSTRQVIFNPQIAIVTGGVGGQVTQIGNNSNSNTNTQFGTPINFFG